ncbi:stage II sporulation protein M [Clostridium chauvoei]|uniref:Stage II sporulation protein M n=2 Tax=Clostridium chauvoei TaxID=46867 RepID=A0ABD4RE48_9CLOT|nr:stage II sporulation protein M [Clostridium chauvoei]ATD55172.1 stage II sporulation protein M [Clostridium chauvoei]ATD57156.1 stage II sporulation protein M [Clostridium chauvoei]MBX7279513.1 stage II sporulation protein M [Clostridium chauvoei]MBX7281882.1 stage II sporulation protein M [Clostridium chauvoei]MBX7284529.1 stage II sporulation protein M [Clostridium chauvoei]
MSIVSKLNSNLKENKVLYILVLVFFFVGIILGSYVVRYMNGGDAQDLSNYFTDFIKSLGEKPIDRGALFFDILKSNIFMIALIIALGFTVFGTPFILIIDLIKGFTLGYTFSFLLTTFSGKGIWVALASTLPQNILYIPFFIGISIISLEISSRKLKEHFFNGNKTNRIITNQLLMKLSIFIGLFVVGVIVETYICPSLIKIIITKVYKIV